MKGPYRFIMSANSTLKYCGCLRCKWRSNLRNAEGEVQLQGVLHPGHSMIILGPETCVGGKG